MKKNGYRVKLRKKAKEPEAGTQAGKVDDEAQKQEVPQVDLSVLKRKFRVTERRR